MPSKKKKYNARFPPARIKKIMQTDEDVGKVAAAVPVIISRSLELFVESLIKKASEITVSRNARTLTASHLKQCILCETKFDFLKDLVASVPDVQGDEESGGSLVSSGEPVVAKTQQPKPRRQKRKVCEKNMTIGGAKKNALVNNAGKLTRVNSTGRNALANSAGPSHGGTEESDEEDEDEEEEDEDDTDDDTSSDVPSTKINNIQQTANFTSPHVLPLVLPSVIVSHGSAASNLDEDYDS